jgi:hypothetical protein
MKNVDYNVKKCPKQLLNASYVSSFMVGVPKKEKNYFL